MKRPKSEVDLLKSRVAKQRNEIGRLTHGPDHGFLPVVEAWLNRNDDETLGNWF